MIYVQRPHSSAGRPSRLAIGVDVTGALQRISLPLEHEVGRADDQQKGHQVVPAEGFLEVDDRKPCKDGKGEDLLNRLQLGGEKWA